MPTNARGDWHLLDLLTDTVYVALIVTAAVRVWRHKAVGGLLYVAAIVCGLKLILALLEADLLFVVLRALATIAWVYLADRYWDREHPIDISSKM